MKLSKTLITLISSILFFALSLSALALEQMLLRNQGAELKEALRTAAVAEANRKNSIELSKLREETAVERTQLSSFVLTQNTLIDFVSTLERVAKEQRVAFQTRTITPVTLEDLLFDEVLIEVNFSGNQNQVLKMIQITESLPYHGLVESVSMNTSAGEWQANVTMRLTIISYD